MVDHEKTIARVVEVLSAGPSRYDLVFDKVWLAFQDLCLEPSLSVQEAFRRNGLEGFEDLKVSMEFGGNVSYLKKIQVEGRIDGFDFITQFEI